VIGVVDGSAVRRPSRWSVGRQVAVVIALAVVSIAGCAGPGASPGASPSTPAAPGASPSTSAAPTRLTVGLGYIPSVQFAQFYLADQAGYYRDAGLAVEFQNKIDPELITLIGQGAVDIGLGDGTSVIPAASQGIPIRYVATVYGRFPNVVLAKQSSGITKPADLKGRKLGTPGRYGSSWVMVQALLKSAGLTTSDIDIKEYPDFSQAGALQRGDVDAATGFANNEPVQLQLAGIPTSLLRVDDITPLPGPGLCVGTKTLETKREAVKAFIAATLRAMRDIAADPAKGLDAAIARVPELGKDRATQLAILQATVDTWQSPYTQAHGLGAIDRAAWQTSIDFMRGLPGLVPNPVTLDQVIVEGLIGG
jgi:NitT/TauT family transport system substrate-binding protein